MLFEAPGPWNDATRRYEITARSEAESKFLEAFHDLLKTRPKESTIIFAKFFPYGDDPQGNGLNGTVLRVTLRLKSRKDQIAQYGRVVEDVEGS